MTKELERVNPPGTVITVQYDLQHIAQTTTQATVNEALRFTEFAWYDCMIGFKELGISPDGNEEERIKRALFKKKLKFLLEKENRGYPR